MSNHTPGPWTCEDAAFDLREDDVLRRPLFGADGCEVCTVIVATDEGSNGGKRDTTADQDRVQGEANARLIAAAPDLLEACSRVLRSIRWCSTEDRLTAEEQADLLRAAIAKATQ